MCTRYARRRCDPVLCCCSRCSMTAPTLYAMVGLLHRSAETVQATQRHVLRLRRRRVISAERAAQTLYDLDTLDFPDQLPDQLGFLLAPSKRICFQISRA